MCVSLAVAGPLCVYDPTWGAPDPTCLVPSVACLQERTACSAPLTLEQLSSLTVAPRQLDFGKLSPAAPGQQPFLVTNPLAAPIHVVLNLATVEGLSCCGPCSQVVPAGGTAKFAVVLHSDEPQHLKETIQYVVNGCHFLVGAGPACLQASCQLAGSADVAVVTHTAPNSCLCLCLSSRQQASTDVHQHSAVPHVPVLDARYVCAVCSRCW